MPSLPSPIVNNLGEFRFSRDLVGVVYLDWSTFPCAWKIDTWDWSVIVLAQGHIGMVLEVLNWWRY